MKHPAHFYAKALAEAASAPDAEGRAIAKNFAELLARNGDEALARKILEEASRYARGKSGIRKVAIGSARPLTPAQRKALAPILRPGDVVVEEVIPDLIAGVRVIVDDEMLFDGSLRGRLDAIFKNN